MIATLVYLAFQIRQNTAALRLASRQEVVAGMRQHMALRLERDGGNVFSIGLERYPDLPEGDRDLFSGLMADHALFMQSAFALHDAGALDDETWRAYLDHFAGQLATPGGAAWWEQVGQPVFVASMVRTIDARLAEGNVPDLLALRPIGAA